MNKKDAVVLISDKLNLPQRNVQLVVDAFLEELRQGLARGEKIMLTNFGSFEKHKTNTFDMYSPYDGKLLKDVNQIRVHFKSSVHLKHFLSNNE